MEHGLCQILVISLLCLSPPSLILPLSPSPSYSPPRSLLGVGVAWAQEDACPPRPTSDPEPPGPGSHGALEPLIQSARSTRQAFLSHELPYAEIRRQISDQ